MSPATRLAKQLQLMQELYAQLSQALPAKNETWSWFQTERPIERLLAACGELSAQPQAYAVGILYVFLCKPGRRDVENKLLTEPLAHALAIAIIGRWETELWACLPRATQRKLDKINFDSWPVGFPHGRQ